jgi:hypothetical protein
MKKKQRYSRQKPKKGAWFVAIRGSYLPASPAGWLTYIPFLVYLVFAVIIGIRDTSSIYVALLFIVPNWVAAAAVMTWLAAQKS